MQTLREAYSRYLRPHRWSLAGTVLAFLLIATSEGVLIGYMMRFIVDEVLQVDQSDQVVTEPAARPGRQLLRHDPPLQQPTAEAPLGRRYAPPVLHRGDPVQAPLQDRIAARNGPTTAQKIRMLLGLGLAIIVAHLLVVWIDARAKVHLGTVNKRVVFHLRRHIFEKLLRLQMSYHDQHHVGRLISRGVEDVRVLEGQLAAVLTHIMQLAGVILVSSAVLFFIHVRLALAVWALVPVFIIVGYVFRKRIRALVMEQRRANAMMWGLGSDRLSHPRVVKGFGQEDRERIRFFRLAARYFRFQIRTAVMKNVLGLFSTALSGLVLAIVLGYGSALVLRGELSLGYLLFAYGAAMAMSHPLAHIGVQLMEGQYLMVVFDRVLSVLGEPVTIADRPGAQPMPQMHKAIQFTKVTHAYEGTVASAVRGIDLEIPAGSHVCLMGQSGSGKSTIAALLLRLYDPTDGQLTVDGVDLRDIANQSLRQQIAYVPQEPMLFSGTIASNIAYGHPEAGRDAIVHAARAAEIHEFIELLPDGYDSVIGENGLRLSGGQKQRLSLARALLVDPQVLVLDDCTSALDAHTEARITSTLRNALKGKTVVMISHRASAAMNADRIVVLQRGRVAEVGTHETLLPRRGAYWRLVRDQLDRLEQAARSA